MYVTKLLFQSVIFMNFSLRNPSLPASAVNMLLLFTRASYPIEPILRDLLRRGSLIGSEVGRAEHSAVVCASVTPKTLCITQFADVLASRCSRNG